jgi:Mrp family chromosome partitioning ATPase
MPNQQAIFLQNQEMKNELTGKRDTLANAQKELSDLVGPLSIEDAMADCNQEVSKLRDLLRTTKLELVERGELLALTNSSLAQTNLATSTAPISTNGSGILQSNASPTTVGPLLSAASNVVESDTNRAASAVQHGAQTNLAGDFLATTNAPIPAEKRKEYQALLARLEQLRKREQELLQEFTEDSVRVKEIRDPIEKKEKEKELLEEQYPELSKLPLAVTNPGASSAQVVADAARGKALIARAVFLEQQLKAAEERGQRIAQLEPKISQLEREISLDQKNYEAVFLSYNHNRLEAAETAAKASINVAQEPTPAQSADNKLEKTAAAIAAGGVFGGLGLAFLIELILNHSVRRPGEIETKFRLPLFITIPDTRRKRWWPFGRSARNGNETYPATVTVEAEEPASDSNAGRLEIAPWSPNNQLQAFYEALRDRLITFFEVHKLVHKPKLIAVTGCSKGAGVSTIAAGLAASLSETGDGNVLLVDMNLGDGAAHLFTKGKPACALTDALENEKRSTALVSENLYVVTDRNNGEKLPQVLPKRFNHLVPRLKASDYDYIIFDMPAINQVSITPRLARFMDMVLLVVESGKSNRDAVKRASTLLAETEATVATVFNKNRTYIPKWLHQDSLADS